MTAGTVYGITFIDCSEMLFTDGTVALNLIYAFINQRRLKLSYDFILEVI
jgi:hypothetical protein